MSKSPTTPTDPKKRARGALAHDAAAACDEALGGAARAYSTAAGVVEVHLPAGTSPDRAGAVGRAIKATLALDGADRPAAERAADLPAETLVLVTAGDLARIRALCDEHGLLDALLALNVTARRLALIDEARAYLGAS